MELIVLIPILFVMGAVAVLMALGERPLPVTSASAFTSITRPRPLRLQLMSGEGVAAKPRDVETIEPLVNTPESNPITEETTSVRDSFSQTDVLLADALTEMIGLKAELYHLRSKLDSLNVEVARLSGGPPRTPPAASKQPVQLRRAA